MTGNILLAYSDKKYPDEIVCEKGAVSITILLPQTKLTPLTWENVTT